ncbi:MAG TPA: redoxin domain-containing protein [Bacteroidia bacterium]|jgi:peroxiredoxin|nr:redoxin domain-containing protein [Bacteroidia bacterium]
MKINIGQQAPEFNLPDQDKTMTSLSAQKGKNVVLLFFPAAFTGTCTKELCQTRDDIAFYNGVNAQVYGISVDLPFSLGKFKTEQNINFPLLSDFNKEAIQAYGSIYDNWILGLKGVAKRSAFVIDKQGAVRYAEVLEDATKIPDFDAIRKVLEGLK